MSCAPKKLQPRKVAVSADILSATACFPTAPGAGTGDVFCILKSRYMLLKILVWNREKQGFLMFIYFECDVLGNEIRCIHRKSCRAIGSQRLPIWPFCLSRVSPLNYGFVCSCSLYGYEWFERGNVHLLPGKRKQKKSNELRSAKWETKKKRTRENVGKVLTRTPQRGPLWRLSRDWWKEGNRRPLELTKIV